MKLLNFLFPKRKFTVPPMHKGLLYFKNQLQSDVLETGIHEIQDSENHYQMVTVYDGLKWELVTNQEVLTKDNIALRLSFYIAYKVVDTLTYAQTFDVYSNRNSYYLPGYDYLTNMVKVAVRERVISQNIEQLNANRAQVLEGLLAELNAGLANVGFKVEQLDIVDISFPKSIQLLFAKQLEAQVRAKTDLEDARTKVAAARALKNAATLMADNDNLKFMHYLDTLKEVAKTGKHTFIFGEGKALPPLIE